MTLRKFVIDSFAGSFACLTACNESPLRVCANSSWNEQFCEWMKVFGYDVVLVS